MVFFHNHTERGESRNDLQNAELKCASVNAVAAPGSGGAVFQSLRSNRAMHCEDLPKIGAYNAVIGFSGPYLRGHCLVCSAEFLWRTETFANDP